MPTGNPPLHTCTNGWWGIGPPPPCPACSIGEPYRFLPITQAPPISDADVERIARRVVELLKERD